ncbi:hypothetical protein CLOM_g5294, partial [Closterium sp. NIES-68]
LQPLEPPQRPWQYMTMDIVIGLPARPNGNYAVLVVVNHLTLMAHFAPCRTMIIAKETVRLFISTIVRLHGIPLAIINDRDPKFTSRFWQGTWNQYSTRLQFSSTYHPQIDGQTERTNQTMEHDQAVGAVLVQDQGNGVQPIAYLSKKLHGAELNYPIHDKEALAIIIAFKMWRCYLEGRQATVYIDHYSLKYLKTQPNLSRRQVRWIDFLETHFHYEIMYKPGHKNKADALSRPANIAAIQ